MNAKSDHCSSNSEHPEGQSGSTALVPREDAVVSPWGGAPESYPGGGGANLLAVAWQSVRRWWKIAAPLGLLIGVITAAALYQIENHPIYRASSWFRIDTRGEFIVFPTQDTSTRFVDTQVELVRSPLVLSPVVRDKLIGQYLLQEQVESPIAWLSSNIQVKLVGESEFLEIAFTCHDANIAKRVVEQVSDAYRLAYERETDSQRQQVIKLLEEEKNKVAERVQQRREDVRMQSKLSLGTDPFRLDSKDALQMQVASRRAAAALDLDRQLLDTQVGIELIEGQILAFAKSYAPGIAGVFDTSGQRVGAGPAGEASGESSLDIEALRDYLARGLASRRESETHKRALAAPEVGEVRMAIKAIYNKQIELRAERASLKPVPALAGGEKRKRAYEEQLAERMKQAQETLDVLLERSKPAIEAELVARDESVLLEFDRKVADLQRQERLHELLMARNAESPSEDEDAQVLTMDLEFARSELQREEDIHRRISDRLLALRTEERAPRRVTLRSDDPYVANLFSRADLYRKVAAGGVAGLLLPFGLAFLWDLTQSRVGGASHARDSLCLPVLGEVSLLPKASKMMLNFTSARFEEQHEYYDDSITHLASQISFTNSLSSAGVLAITSAVSGEGKSTLTAHLAAALARQHHEPVLVVDTDFRNPSIGRLLGVDSRRGIAEVLQGDLCLEEAIQSTEHDHLYVLTTGESNEAPRHQFANGELRKVLQQLRANFRYVLIDTAPVLSSAETLPIAQASDAIIISTLRDVSRVAQIRLALEKLSFVGGRVAGAVINGVPPRAYRYSHGFSSRPANKRFEADHAATV